MKIVRRNYIVLLLLCFIFVAPGLSAYLFYAHPAWLNHATTNRGVLLNPPMKSPNLGKDNSKWTLVLWYPKVCDKICVQQLNKLARVRLALGRRLYALQLVLLVDNKTAAVSEDLGGMLHERDIYVSTLPHHEKKSLHVLGNDPRIYIANPKQYLILAYPTAVSPGDIYHDIKQLLN